MQLPEQWRNNGDNSRRRSSSIKNLRVLAAAATATATWRN
jgi:hypothetical protein